MKILHTIASIAETTGGPARSSQGLIAALQRNHVDAWLYSFTEGEVARDNDLKGFRAMPYLSCCNTKDKIRQNPFGVVNGILPPIYSDLKQMQKAFEDLVEEVCPDIIHVHAIWGMASHIACLTARKKNIPYIIAPRGMLEPWSLQQKRWKKCLAMRLYQRKDLCKAVALHATAESEAEQFIKLGFKQPIIVSPNGVDFPATMPPRVFRSDGKKTVLFLSRIHPKKGLMELVEAWANLKKKSATVHKAALLDWYFEYAGPDYDGHLDQIQKRIKDLGVEEDFTYLGNLGDNEKWTAYRRADLFVLPTYSENFGIVIAEALAAGVPVLTTTGAPWQALIDKRCGWWIAPGLNSLMKILPEVLMVEREQLEKMGQRGARYVYETFGWQSIAVEMKQVYQWILYGGESPTNVKKI